MSKVVTDKQQSEVQQFFDEIAQQYVDKYDQTDSFYEYFFFERLHAATSDINFDQKTILDIGAGTGPLYDFLTKTQPNTSFNYYATDISPEMLQNSNVPSENRFVGNAYNNNFAVQQFDLVYMLGVSTYMPAQELQKNLEYVEKVLKDDGLFIITFTNKSSFDFMIRTIFKTLFRPFLPKGKVLSQGFNIYSYSPETAEKTIQPFFQKKAEHFLNHTIFPLDKLMKKGSVALAKKIKKNISSPFWKKQLSSDFLWVLKRK